MESTSVHPLVLAAIRNTKGEARHIAKRYGVSAELVREAKRGRTYRHTPDQIREVYTSTEKASEITKRTGMCSSIVSRIRSGKLNRDITSGLTAPIRKRRRTKEDHASEKRLRRRAKLQREQARRCLRNAILRSREFASVTARELGCSRSHVNSVRAAHGWVSPKRKAKVTPKRPPPPPKYDYPRRPVGRPRVRPVGQPRPKKVKPIKVSTGRPKALRPANLQPFQTMKSRLLGLTPGIDWTEIANRHRNTKIGTGGPIRYRPSYGLITILMYRIPVGSQKQAGLDKVSEATR